MAKAQPSAPIEETRHWDTHRNSVDFAVYVLCLSVGADRKSSDEVVLRRFHLIGTLALAAGVPEPRIREYMKNAFGDQFTAEDWDPEPITP